MRLTPHLSAECNVGLVNVLSPLTALHASLVLKRTQHLLLSSTLVLTKCDLISIVFHVLFFFCYLNKMNYHFNSPTYTVYCPSSELTENTSCWTVRKLVASPPASATRPSSPLSCLALDTSSTRAPSSSTDSGITCSSVWAAPNVDSG